MPAPDYDLVRRCFRNDRDAARLYVARRLYAKGMNTTIDTFDRVTGARRSKWLDRADRALSMHGIRFWGAVSHG